MESIKRVRINRLHYCCQCSRDIVEILLQDIDAEINILNDIFSSDIVSPSAQKLVESSVDTLRSNIMEEITERVANVLYEKFELFDNFYSKRLKNFIRNLENFRNTTSEELAEISKNIKLLENISNDLIFNRSCETQAHLQSLSSPGQPLQNTGNVKNKSSP